MEDMATELTTEREPQEKQPAAVVPPPRRSRARAAQVVSAIVVVLAGCYFAKMVFVILLVSILLAFVLAPIPDVLERIRIPRSLGALVAVLLLCAAIFGAFLYSYNAAEDFATQLPKYSGQIRAKLTKYMQQAERLQKSTQSVLPTSQNKPQQTVVVQQSPDWGGYLTRGFGSVGEFLFAIGFIPFLVFFMLSWQEHVRSATVMLFRMENRNTAYVTLGAISKMIRSFLGGNFVVGLFMAGVMMLVFALIGLPYFYFIGFLCGFLSLVPYLGVVLALVPPLVVGIGHIHSTQLIVIVITVLTSHIVAINVLYPKIVGSRVSLNPLAVTVSLLFWGWLWGAWGLILAVPITAAMKIIFDHVETMRAYGAWLGE
jgi:predicted PurR-regulated permease PerM